MIWKANAPLAPDSYTVTFKGGPGGVTDLRGNALDGETGGRLVWPRVSGNGTPGGDFVTTFTVNAADTTPAAVSWSSVNENDFNHDRFEVHFTDEIDAASVYSSGLVLRGAGADGKFNTADDTFPAIDLAWDALPNTTDPQLLAYSRGRLDAGLYRLEGTIQDAVGNPVTIAETFTLGLAPVAGAFLSQTRGGAAGLVGSYFNGSFRDLPAAVDWRTNHSVAGTRVDTSLDFVTESWGTRSTVGITGGTDANWDDYSVQWDGYITIPASGVELATRSDDSSRMWIDRNNDGVFSSSELVDNHWGSGQAATTGPLSSALPAGTYRIRIQYEEGGGGNELHLLWLNPQEQAHSGAVARPPSVAALNVAPGSVATTRVDRVDITFSAAVNPATLTTSSVRLRYSPDPTFFDANDSYHHRRGRPDRLGPGAQPSHVPTRDGAPPRLLPGRARRRHRRHRQPDGAEPGRRVSQLVRRGQHARLAVASDPLRRRHPGR